MKFNINEIVRPHLVGIQSYKSLRNSYLAEEMMFLDANENPFGAFNRYPDAEHLELRAKLAEINRVSMEKIFLGNGSDDLIDMAIRIFCEPQKDSIMVFDPSFVMYEISAKINNVAVEKINLDKDFQLNKAEFEEALSNTQAKILFLCSPNNPTGNSIDDLEFFIKSFNGIVIVDEAYIEFSPNESAVRLLEKYPHLIVLKTLSKGYGMAGLRIGVGIASTEIASFFNQCKAPFNINSQSQLLALTQLENAENLQKNIKIILEEKEKVRIGLEKLNFVVKIFPSDANFFLIEFKDAELVYQTLLKAKIMTSLRHPGLKNCLRLNIGTAEENKVLLNVLSTI